MEIAAPSPWVTSTLETAGKAYDDGKKVHMMSEHAGMNKVSEGIPLTDDPLGQLDRASTAEDGVENT